MNFAAIPLLLGAFLLPGALYRSLYLRDERAGGKPVFGALPEEIAFVVIASGILYALTGTAGVILNPDVRSFDFAHLRAWLAGHASENDLGYLIDLLPFLSATFGSALIAAVFCGWGLRRLVKTLHLDLIIPLSEYLVLPT